MTKRVMLRPVYAPNMLLLGPIAWEAEIEFSGRGEGASKDKLLLSVQEAAKVLGMGRTVVNEMTNDGTLPVRIIRGRKKIRRDDLDEFVKQGPRARWRRKAA